MAFQGGGLRPKGEDDFFQCGGYRHKNRRYLIKRHPFSGRVAKITSLLVVISLFCLGLNRYNYYMQKSSSFRRPQEKLAFTFHGFKSEYVASQENDVGNRLKDTLKIAAMEDQKTVIITTLNAAWIEPGSIFDLFLESFRSGIQTQSLVKHLVVVAFDQKAYSRCLELHLHCFALSTAGVDFSGKQHITSKIYYQMIWRRVGFLSYVLEMGYNFIFTDADIMWLRDPFPRFDPTGDLNLASDMYKHNSSNLSNKPNAGFIYAKSSNRTIQFYKFWYAKRIDFPFMMDQSTLDILKTHPFVKEIGLEIRYLNTAYFGGLCFPKQDLDVAVTLHANCCTVLEDKIHDIKMVLDDWKEYVAEDDQNKITRSWNSASSWKCGVKKI